MAQGDEDRIRPRDRVGKRMNKVGSPADVLAQAEAALAAQNPTNPQYNYSDPGRFGDPRYEYQVGDEMTAPGPEPPRDSPEWADWKKHAAAWRNFIGGRQQYVNSMIATGYNPEDLGIFNRKEEGQAGYRRLTANNNSEINRLRAHGANWMRGSDAEIDPRTGLYVTGGPSNRQYFDTGGMRVNQGGQRVGGFYGMGNTMGQYGIGAVPRAGQATMGTRAMAPGVGGQREPLQGPPRPAPFAPTGNTGWGAQFGSPRPRPRPRPYSPYGI